MSASSHLFDRQNELYGLIARSIENLRKLGDKNISRGRIQSRIDTLEFNWNKFQTNHDEIMKVRNDHKDHTYFTSNLYDLCEEKYLNSKGDLIDLFEEFSDNPTSQDANPIDTKQCPRLSRSHQLPKIELPKFSGSYTEWSCFRDIFTSMVISNADLSSVEKLHYLKMAITGEPAQLLKNVETCGKNFTLAWDMLVERYDNKRILIDAHLSSLFNARNIKNESSSEIKRLIGEIKESLGALKTLGSPIEHWDDILVFMFVRKLDSDSLKDWEKSVSSSSTPTTFSMFEEFLNSRIHTLEAIEQISAIRKAPSKPNPSVKAHNTSASSKLNCTLCKGDHYIARCSEYLSKSPTQRKEIIKLKNLCFNCLGPHALRDCRTSKTCRICNRQHHTTIHLQSNTQTPQSNAPSYQGNRNSPEVRSNLVYSHATSTSSILLATAVINVYASSGSQYSARALLDQGSEVSFISESFAQLLKLERKGVNISVIGVGSTHTATAYAQTSFQFSSRFDNRQKFKVNALILKKLTSYTPPKIQGEVITSFRNLSLADPDILSNRKIDIVLGAEIYSRILEHGLQKSSSTSIIAQKTSLGWILSGPSSDGTSPDGFVYGFQCSLDEDLKEVMNRFWAQEDIKSLPPVVTKEEKDCEDHFRETVCRDPDGRFVVRLPICKPISQLGDTYLPSLNLLHSMEKRFAKNSNLESLYRNFMEEYEKLNHMIKIANPNTVVNPVFLPHHGVLRESSTSTKLRVVFNGSYRTSSGLSLNDHLYAGPKLQTELTDVLLRWRRHKFVFASDLEKMYRQILVHEDDQHLQQILWRSNPNDPVQIFQLRTVTYGLSCAPFLAIRCLQELGAEHAQEFPEANHIIRHNTYVDDILSGADSIENAKRKISQLNTVFRAGGFTAKKWIANSPMLLEELPPENLAPIPSYCFEDSFYHTLGLIWCASEDKFFVKWKSLTHSSIPTKRIVLSQIAKMFDPLGWLAPIVVLGKRFMQELWTIKLEWDEPLPENLNRRWNDISSQIETASSLSIPRWIGLSPSMNSIELHGFSDASQDALGAVIYMRTCSGDSVLVRLVSAKTKVAPLKKVTVPRLELCAAVLLTRLTKSVCETLEISDIPIYLWSDSTVALSWINSHPSRWKEFVRNRVAEVQDFASARWHHISGQENPADLASRGVFPSQLQQDSIWWSGPKWLAENTWRTQSPVSSPEVTEERAVYTNVATSPKICYWNLLERYSSLHRLLRVTAWCQRFVSFSKQKKIESIAGVLAPIEISNALQFWVKHVQQLHYADEVKLLSHKKTVPRSSPLYRLIPFLDGNGILRLSGRLKFANLTWEEKHPIILPKDSPLSLLIIRQYHAFTLHGGTQTTLASIRRKFWILNGRNAVRSIIHRCIICARQRAVTAQQLMGQLPKERVIPSRPFLHSGVDYAGPFKLRTQRGRGSKFYKGYLIIFVCFSTSAIHLEVASDYTSAGFIAAYKRFTGRRGICATLTSDCGTNLIGADRELKSLLNASNREFQIIACKLSEVGTLWRFNPPSAPHFGGKWEAGVKSTKLHLKRIVGDNSLTYEEFSTLLVEIEAVLNSRPLCPLNDDPNCVDVLTPGHFLIGDALKVIPEPSALDQQLSRLTRWRLIRKMSEHFWQHWSKYYLQYIQNSSKWFESKSLLKPGSLVLIKDERFPPTKWALGRIIELHPGRDGLQRVATVKTAASVFVRPITKLCQLPIDV